MAAGYPPITLAVNKFLGALTNLIAYSQTLDTLEDGELNRLVASCQDINVDNGDGKVVLAADVLQVTDLPTNSTLLSTAKPTVKEQYIPVTDYKVVQMTINRYLMRGAFIEEAAMGSFIAYLMSVMRQTKNIYLYNELVKMYKNYTPTQNTQTVTVPLYALADSDTADLRQAKLEYNSNAMYNALIMILTEMGADTTAYNDLGLTEVIDYKSLKFVGNSYFNTQMLINTLATLLNSDKITDAQKWSETIVIPQGKLNDTTTIGWLGHKKKIQFGYFYNVATSFFDGSTLNQNNWLHFSYYMDEVDALPMVKFVAAYSEKPTQFVPPQPTVAAKSK